MTPSIGTYSNNLGNFFYFSSCSIKMIKSNLLVNNGIPRTNAACLKNKPETIPTSDPSTFLGNYLPGQLWVSL
jgi:hypothetical protein